MKLTVKDAAQLLGVSEKTIYRWINHRYIPAYLINGQYRFNRAELLEWATSRRLAVSPELAAEPESEDVPCVDLVPAIEAGGIHYRVGGVDRESALRAAVEIMRLPDAVDRDVLLGVLLAREALESTGTGDGIAIPHARNPIVLHVARPTLTLCFLERPVEFNALDGQPVRVLFTLISPTQRAHLYLLSRLGFALRDSGFHAALAREASREDILAEARRIETSFRKDPRPASQSVLTSC